VKVLFITPLVSRRYATPAVWEGVGRRLQMTIASLSRQTLPDWKIMVVGSEMPSISANLQDYVIFVKADLEIDNPLSRGRREIDKQRKLYCGYAELCSHRPEYIMPLDYDDLVSVNLVKYIGDHPESDAFILQKGYIYSDGDDFCRYSRRIYMRTGSNIVVRYKEHLFPESVSDFAPPPSGYLDWPFVASHIKRPEQLFQSLNLSYRMIPFPAVIWRRNSDSISNAYQSDKTISASLTNPFRQWGGGYVTRIREFALRKKSRKLYRKFGCDLRNGFRY